MPNEGSYEAALRRSNEVHEELKVNPGKYTMLTGDRPTGRLHLGHYFGTLVDRVRLQEMGVRTNIIIADYQVITDRDTTKNIQDNVFNMVVDYLACGIDPEKTMIFTHSAVPEANQLMLPFLSLVTEAEMERNPTVKAEQEASGHELTGLLLTYPVHQACDILFCKGNIVPVGRDQLPHIEVTNKIARRFNKRYGKVVTEAVNGRFAEIRERREELLRDPDYIRDVLADGNKRANEIAHETLGQVREAMGMVY